jgi:hypothetical protein
MLKHMSNGVQNILDMVWELMFKALECQLNPTIFCAKVGIVLGFYWPCNLQLFADFLCK